MTLDGAGGRVGATTLEGTLVAGEVVRAGTVSAYRAIALEAGEPHVVRTDLADSGPRTGRRVLATFAHATDLQLADVGSPGRFEFCNRYRDDPDFRLLVPMHRPQEALAARAAEAMVRSLDAIAAAPVTGAPLDVVVTTGDAVDNAQWNELRLFLDLLDGGRVRPASGGGRYVGVQSTAWGDPSYWRPDAEGDDYQVRHGFPRMPGLLDAAVEAFEASGMRHPWLSCFGNHEALTQGVALLTEPLQGWLVGARKPTTLPAGLDPRTLHDVFLATPELFLGGTVVDVRADPDRRQVGRAEFVAAHLADGTTPYGHGFTERNRRDGTAYYVHDVGEVRFICLDTTCSAGGADGWLDEDQRRWLEDSLAEVHASHLAPDGSVVHTGADDRLVVVFSHHGPDTMTNTRGLVVDDEAGAMTSGPALEALLHRYGNVVAWVNGHTHRNRLTPRPDPTGRTGGFWEITTSALADWPCQTRVVELVADADGGLCLVTTMVDHDGLVRPDPVLARDGRWLAGLHRELAGNEPWHGFDAGRRGAVTDRNAELRLRAPYPVRP